MRVTPGITTARVTANLARTLAAMSRTQEQLSSGRRITEPADDPGGAAQAVGIRSQRAASEQFRKNIAAARSSLATTDTTVRAVSDVLVRAKEAAIQGSNDSNDALSRRALAGQADQILEELFALANDAAPDGAKLFGGQETLVAPYAATRDADGRITAVVANPRGIDGETRAEVAEGLTVATAISGTDVFGDAADATAAFGTLIRLRDALDAADGAAIRDTLGDLDSAIDRAALASTVVGTRLGWIISLDERHQDQEVVLSESLARLEDLDYVRAVQQLTDIEAAHEAGLAAAARVIRQSLLDFLR